MEGFDGPGTFLFRTIDDCARIADCARDNRRAAVIGGGLLGLEAARGLLTHGVEVTVLEAAPQLMVAQLDPEAGDMLRKTIEAMGIRVLCNTITTKIAREDGHITHLEFKDGSTLDTDMVVVSAGIRPIAEVAAASGLSVNKAIVCDDQMRTSDPAIFAVGECVEHRGQSYGLVDPIWEQANVLADVITGTRPDSAYHGSKLGTKLKVMGVELASMGVTRPADADDEVIVYREPGNGIYKKLIVRGGQIAGAILLGDVEAAGTLMQMFLAGTKVPARRADLLFGSPTGVSLLKVADLPDNAQICNCNGVSKQQIVDAIQAKGVPERLEGGRLHQGRHGLRLVQGTGGAAARVVRRGGRLRPERALLRAGRAAGEVAARGRDQEPRHQVASARSSRSSRAASRIRPARSAWRRC